MLLSSALLDSRGDRMESQGRRCPGDTTVPQLLARSQHWQEEQWDFSEIRDVRFDGSEPREWYKYDCAGGGELQRELHWRVSRDRGR